MIELTQNLKRLAVYGNFETICQLPSNKRAIEALVRRLAIAIPNFYTEEGVFWVWEYNEKEVYNGVEIPRRRQLYEGYTDFDHTVLLLKEVFMQGLDDDSGPGRKAVLERYGLALLPGERYAGQAIHEVLNQIQESVAVAVAFTPRDKKDVEAYADALKAKEAEDEALRTRLLSLCELPQKSAFDGSAHQKELAT